MRVGRGSEWAGAVLTPGRSGDGKKSVFQSISRHQNFRVTQTEIQTDQGTHPLIESLRQRLKSHFRPKQVILNCCFPDARPSVSRLVDPL